jgi:2-methylisocitrate lyase-like PEP mutase family enzyme
MSALAPDVLASRCEALRSLHRPGTPLLLPNAWDVPTARAVVAAGYPVVATTSLGVAATLGCDDHHAPGDEMLAAAARIARCVDAPVTIDAEDGYGMEPAALVDALRAAGAAGCNLEDTDHAAAALRDVDEHAAWLRQVRDAANAASYPLVINARVDSFFASFLAGEGPGSQQKLLPDARQRARAYLDAGVDCVYPIGLWETDVIRDFTVAIDAPVNVTHLPDRSSLAELTALGVSRVSWAIFLYVAAMARFSEHLAALPD